MIKTIVFNLESIADMQKILKIQNNSPMSSPIAAPVTKPAVKRSYVEDLNSKYTNIKVRKIVVEKPAAPEINKVVAEKQPLMKMSSPISPIKPPVREYKSIHRSLAKSPVRAQQEAPKTQSAEKPAVVRTIAIINSNTPVKAHCRRCNAKFDDKETAEAHGNSCTVGKGKKHPCFCGEILDTASELDKHFAACHSKNDERPRCKPCKKLFLTNAAYFLHQDTDHSAPTRKVYKAPMATVTCTICHTKMKTEADLKAHLTTCRQRKSAIEA